jgi:predicted nucleotidyltransferase
MTKLKRAKKELRGARDRDAPAGNLLDALFSRTQQRTLGFLFGQPDRSFYGNELIALTGSGSGAIQRELRRLADSGLVTVTATGGRTYYRANQRAPLFTELRSMMLKTIGLGEPIRAALAASGGHIGLAAIYGSVAKGTETADSDIDLLIVSNDLTLEKVYAALVPAESQLSRKISVTLYTEDEFRNRLRDRTFFLTRILAGEHFVLIGSVHGPTTPR